MDELNGDKVSRLKGMLSYQKIKYLKMVDMRCTGKALAGLSCFAERVCCINTVFEIPNKEISKSICRYLILKSCGGLQHTFRTRFLECEQASLTNCDVNKYTFQQFGEKLRLLICKQTYTVDSRLCKYIAIESKFTQLQQLDLSQNSIDYSGYLVLVSAKTIFCQSLKKLILS